MNLLFAFENLIEEIDNSIENNIKGYDIPKKNYHCNLYETEKELETELKKKKKALFFFRILK